MTDSDWLDCQTYLTDTWPGKAKLFQHVLWRNSFGHLSKVRFLKAVNAHFQESYSVPTIAQLRQHLHTSDHVHRFEPYLDTVWCNTCGTHGPGCQCQHCTCPHDWSPPEKASNGVWWRRCGWCKGVRRQ